MMLCKGVEMGSGLLYRARDASFRIRNPFGSVSEMNEYAKIIDTKRHRISS
jgi:hypothetical protein